MLCKIKRSLIMRLSFQYLLAIIISLMLLNLNGVFAYGPQQIGTPQSRHPYVQQPAYPEVNQAYEPPNITPRLLNTYTQVPGVYDKNIGSGQAANPQGNNNQVPSLMNMKIQQNLGYNGYNYAANPNNAPVNNPEIGGNQNPTSTVGNTANPQGKNIQGNGYQFSNLPNSNQQQHNATPLPSTSITSTLKAMSDSTTTAPAPESIPPNSKDINIQGNGTLVSSVLNSNPPFNSGFNLLSNVATKLAIPNNSRIEIINSTRSGNFSNQINGGNSANPQPIHIQGNDNKVPSFSNLNHQLNVDVNRFNTLQTQLANPERVGIFLTDTLRGVNSPAIGGNFPSQPIQMDDDSSKNIATNGDWPRNVLKNGRISAIGVLSEDNALPKVRNEGNRIFSLFIVDPRIETNVNAFNGIRELEAGNSQTASSASNIDGRNNRVFTLLTINPDINADVNVVNSVKRTRSAKSGLLGDVTGGSALKKTPSKLTNQLLKGSKQSLLDKGLSGVQGGKGGTNIIDPVTKPLSGLIGGALGDAAGVAGDSALNGALGPVTGAVGGILDDGAGVSGALDTVTGPVSSIFEGAGNSAIEGAVEGAAEGVLDKVTGVISGSGAEVLDGLLGNTVGGVLGDSLGGAVGNVLGGGAGQNNLINPLTKTVPEAAGGLFGDLPGKFLSGAGGGLLSGVLDSGDDAKQSLNSATNTVGGGNKAHALLNIEPQVKAAVNLLNNVQQVGSNNFGRSQDLSSDTNRQGNNNRNLNLINVDPQGGVGINALNKINRVGEGNGIGGAQIQDFANGNNNQDSGLVDVSPQVRAGINVLNNINQVATGEAGNSIGGTQSLRSSSGLLNVDPQVDVGLNALNKVKQVGEGNGIRGAQIQDSTDGNNNRDSGLLNVSPQVAVGLNTLNNVKQLSTGEAGNSIGGTQSLGFGTGPASTLFNVSPQVEVGVNALNKVKQLGRENRIGGSQKVGFSAGSNLPNAHPHTHYSNIGAFISDSRQKQQNPNQINKNRAFGLLNFAPQVGVGANVLNDVVKGASGVPTNSIGGGSKVLNTGHTSNQNSGLLNLSPQVDVAVNALNRVTQQNAGLGGAADDNFGGAQILNSPSGLINVSPQVNADVNALNRVNQLSGLGGAGSSIGSSKTINSPSGLINVSPQVNADVNALNRVNQRFGFPIGASQKLHSPSGLINVSPQVNAYVNALNRVNQQSDKNGAGSSIGNSQTLNSPSGLINVSPQVNADVNALNRVNQLSGLGGAGSSIGSSKTLHSSSGLINVSPQVNADVNALNRVNQLSGLGGAGSSIGSSKTINSPSGLINVSPQVNADVNALNRVNQRFGFPIGASQKLISGGQNSGAGNKVASLLNLSPQVNADVNALNAINQQTGSLLGGTAGGAPQTNDPTADTLANVSPQIDVNLNLLNQVQGLTKLLGNVLENPDNVGDLLKPGTTLGDALECEVIGDQTHTTGNNNQGGSLIDISPHINIDLNLLNNVKQKLRCRLKAKPTTTTILPPNQVTTQPSTLPSKTQTDLPTELTPSFTSILEPISHTLPPLTPQHTSSPPSNCFEVTDYDINGNKGKSRIVCVPQTPYDQQQTYQANDNIVYKESPIQPTPQRCYRRRCNKWSGETCCYGNNNSQQQLPLPLRVDSFSGDF